MSDTALYRTDVLKEKDEKKQRKLQQYSAAQKYKPITSMTKSM